MRKRFETEELRLRGKRYLNVENVRHEARKITTRHWFTRVHCAYSLQRNVDIGGDTVRRRKQWRSSNYLKSSRQKISTSKKYVRTVLSTRVRSVQYGYGSKVVPLDPGTGRRSTVHGTGISGVLIMERQLKPYCTFAKRASREPSFQKGEEHDERLWIYGEERTIQDRRQRRAKSKRMTQLAREEIRAILQRRATMRNNKYSIEEQNI